MKRAISLAILVVTLALSMSADENLWLHVFRNDMKFYDIKADKLKGMTVTDSNGNFNSLQISSADGSTTSISLSSIDSCRVAGDLPEVYITLPSDPYKTEITSKVDYVDCEMSIIGNQFVESVSGASGQIRGRGNSTWSYAKKPYRLKFSKKVEITGLRKAKSYVLIANYIDGTHMRNAIAFKIAQLLGMPYTNNNVPVRVWLNGIEKGIYLLTEKVGINSGSVDIDENEGVLFELDSYYDETYKFRSSTYYQPVMIKDPDLDELAQTTGVSAATSLSKWKNAWNAMELSVASGNPWSNIDLESFVNFVLVCHITGNHEPKHPKSVYVYRTNASSPYYFGPAWDFDWAYTYDGDGASACAPTAIFQSGNSFFTALCKNPSFIAAFSERWDYFVKDLWPEVEEFMEEYADYIEAAARKDGVLWSQRTVDSSAAFRANFADLKTWLQKRLIAISASGNYLLY